MQDALNILITQEEFNNNFINYTYDSLGNIKTKQSQENQTTYTYDALERLIEEQSNNNLITYSYNTNGNIISKQEYLLEEETPTLLHTTTYTYNDIYKDRLDSYKVDQTTYNITYQNTLYPTNYKNNTITWDRGNITQIGTNTYEYNSSNIRTKKTVGTKVHTYTLDNTNIIKEHILDTTNNINVTLEYIYDANNTLVGVIENENIYYYDRDITGLILGLVDTNGNYVVKYTYTAYGEVEKEVLVNNNVSTYNPFMYKGYYYDVETNLYYCKSRYYSPELCRFISPDSIEYLDPSSINGINLYCYCGNNPIMYYDPNGTFDWNNFCKTALGVTAAVGLAALAIGATIVSGGSFGTLAAGFAMGAAASFVGQGIGNVLSGENFFNDFSVGSIIMGGLAGAAFATGVGGFWGAVAIGAVSNAGTSALENKSWANIGASAIVGGVAAGIGFGAGRVVSNRVFKNSGMTFMDYFELGIIDTNAIFAAGHAFAASWYTFLPSLATSASRGVTKALGNKGIGWF